MYRAPVLATSLAATLLATAGLSGASPALAAGAVVSLSQGHVDAIDIAVEDGDLEVSVHDESVEPDVERDPASVRFVVKPAAEVQVPDDPDYAFLGAPGRTVWLLPEVEDENLLWLGLATEEIEPGVLVGDSVSVRFTKFVGPDGVSMFDTAADGGPNVLADSEDGQADVVTQAAGVHRHQNVAFEAPGTYQITYVATARLAATGARISSDPTTLTFVVQP